MTLNDTINTITIKFYIELFVIIIIIIIIIIINLFIMCIVQEYTQLK